MMIRLHRLFFVAGIVLLSLSCSKDKALPDPRLKYVGDWNFKSNHYSYSGNYVYGAPGSSPVWTYTETSTTGFNDSTGSIRLGPEVNQLIIKYCGNCSEEIYDLERNGLDSWTLDSTHFFNDIHPMPPGYTPVYSTYNIEGWKL